MSKALTHALLLDRSHGDAPRVLTLVSGGSSRALVSTCPTLDMDQTGRPGIFFPAVIAQLQMLDVHDTSVSCT